MDVSLKLCGVFVSRFCCSGGRFYTILVSFGGHFGDILVSFWFSWASFGDPGPPRGPKGTPKGTKSKTGWLTPVRAHAFDHPTGSLWGAFFGKFCVLCGLFSRFFFEALFGRFLGSLGTPSNHQNDGLVYTKLSFSHFHLYPQNDRKLSPNGYLFGSLWAVLGSVGHHFGG